MNQSHGGCMFLLKSPLYDDVIEWKHFTRYWPFVQGIPWSPGNSPHKGQWHGALMFSLICAWINIWVNNHEAGGLRRHRALYDVIVMVWYIRAPLLPYWQGLNKNAPLQHIKATSQVCPCISWVDVYVLRRTCSGHHQGHVLRVVLATSNKGRRFADDISKGIFF